MGWVSSLFRRSETSQTATTDVYAPPQPSEKAPLAHYEDPLAPLSLDRERRGEMLEQFVNWGGWILAIRLDAESEAETPDELLRDIKQQAQLLSEDRFGAPYTYLRKGSTVLPVFSTMDAAHCFIKRLKIKKATAFQCLHTKAGFWANNAFALTRVILNPFSNCETEFSETELERIRAFANKAVGGSQAERGSTQL